MDTATRRACGFYWIEGILDDPFLDPVRFPNGTNLDSAIEEICAAAQTEGLLA
jgi:hypothetical protein